MKLFLTSLLIAITFTLNTTTAFSEVLADDDELNTSMHMFADDMGKANAQASNCSDEEALSRVRILRRRSLERFAEAGFPLKSVEWFDDYIQKNNKDETGRMGRRCDEESLKTFMKSVEWSYKDLADVLSRYFVPQ